jgi:hypothetical protein
MSAGLKKIEKVVIVVKVEKKHYVIASEARQPRRMLSGYASSKLFYSPCIAKGLPRFARNDIILKITTP